MWPQSDQTYICLCIRKYNCTDTPKSDTKQKIIRRKLGWGWLFAHGTVEFNPSLSITYILHHLHPVLYLHCFLQLLLETKGLMKMILIIINLTYYLLLPFFPSSIFYPQISKYNLSLLLLSMPIYLVGARPPINSNKQILHSEWNHLPEPKLSFNLSINSVLFPVTVRPLSFNNLFKSATWKLKWPININIQSHHITYFSF